MPFDGWADDAMAPFCANCDLGAPRSQLPASGEAHAATPRPRLHRASASCPDFRGAEAASRRPRGRLIFTNAHSSTERFTHGGIIAMAYTIGQTLIPEGRKSPGNVFTVRNAIYDEQRVGKKGSTRFIGIEPTTFWNVLRETGSIQKKEQ
ncbi:hypothetical protein PWT90_02575 [Aphanocladium album]|nr:hypothetical protein PWT90_02575 [Aphanocladium album]